MVNKHCFTNDTTDLIAYSLDHYDEVEDIDDCHLIYKTTRKDYNSDKTGARFMKAFQLFKILTNNIGKLITPMPFNRRDYAHTMFMIRSMYITH